MTQFDDELLNAYADGELDGEERAQVEAALDADPNARARLAAIRRVTALGRATVDELTRKAVPETLRERVWPLDRAFRSTAPFPSWSALGWAAVICLSLGLGIGGWLAAPTKAPLEQLTAQPAAWDQQAAWYHGLTADRHARSQSLPLDLEHSEETPLADSLAQRLKRPVVVPDLSSQGLELLGARLLVEDLRPLAQVYYRDQQDGLVSLLVALDGGSDSPPSYRQVNETPVLSWRDGGSAYVLAGAQSRQRLHGLAVKVREQVRR